MKTSRNMNDLSSNATQETRDPEGPSFTPQSNTIPIVELVTKEYLPGLKTRINDVFSKENITYYTITDETLEEILNDFYESLEYQEKKTEELKLLNPIAVLIDEQLFLPPQKQVWLEEGDLVYIDSVSVMIQKGTMATQTQKEVHVYEHAPKESEFADRMEID